MATITEKIVAAALQYLGKQEKTGNSGFVDAAFEREMAKVGWKKGESWCAYFTELVWKAGFVGDPAKFKIIDSLFSGSAVATAANFTNNATFKTGKVPKPGAVVIWKLGNGWKGHAGIVETVNGNEFTSIEGNTNAAGGREGIEVARKKRKTGEPFKEKGLNIVTFIYPE